jgi:hypothetical protein
VSGLAFTSWQFAQPASLPKHAEVRYADREMMLKVCLHTGNDVSSAGYRSRARRRFAEIGRTAF